MPKRPTVLERTRLQNCEERWLKWIARAAVASDDGHLRAAAVTDTHLLDFIFYCQTKKKKKKKGEDSSLFAAVELEVGMRFRGNTQFASAVGLALGLLCAVEAAKGN